MHILTLGSPFDRLLPFLFSQRHHHVLFADGEEAWVRLPSSYVWLEDDVKYSDEDDNDDGDDN